jgi:hypothetical protein
MKKWMWLASLAVVATAAFAVVPQLAADHHEQGEAEMTPEQKAAMEMWQKLATPGEHHEHLAMFEGNWESKSEMWMAPGGEATEISGHSENKMILGGRYLVQEFKGTFMGKAYEGLGVTGYDNLSKTYNMVWIDNMGTMMLTMSGTCDGTGKTTTMTGTYPNPETGEDATMKSVMTMADENTMVYVMYMPSPEGGEFKHMEITYTRTGGGSAKKAGY